MAVAVADNARVRRLAATTGVVALVAVASLAASDRSDAAPPPGAEACPVFPDDSYWHADVSGLPVHERSAAWLATMGGGGRRLHPDFGPSGGALPYGIPYDVVGGGEPKVGVRFDYDDESDPGPYPFSERTTIEGGSDRHALVIDRDACVLYELFAADWNGGDPTAGSGAVYDLRSNALRPDGWTSADAAGLPIFPGLLRLDEVRAGHVDHAVRVTASQTDGSYRWPARHEASSANDPNRPPMGAWFRMRADVDISGYRPETQVILTAFKTHGLIVADNGSNWYFTGSADEGWDGAVLDELKSIRAESFEAVDASALMVSPDSGRARSVTGPPPPALPDLSGFATRPAPGPEKPGTTGSTTSAPAPPAAAEPAPTTATTQTTTTTGPAGGELTARSPVTDAGDPGPSGLTLAAVVTAVAALGGAGWRLRRRRRPGRAPGAPV
ncbi:MAG: hypothetical protein AB7H43_09945 [Acidimicrobiia bacterium]